MIRNIAQLGISHFSRIASSVLIFVVLARLWGPELFGEFAYWFAVANLIALLADLGAANYLLSVVGADSAKARAAFIGVARLRLVVSVIVLFFCFVISVMWLGFFHGGLILLSLLFAAMLATATELCFIPVRAVGRYGGEMRDTTIASLGTVFLVLAAALVSKNNVWSVVAALVVSRSIALGIAVRRVLMEGITSAPSVDFRVRIKDLIPFASDSALTNLSSNLDAILMKALFGVHAVGIYQAGARLVQGGLTFAPVLAGVYLPKLASALGVKHDVSVGLILTKSLRMRMGFIGFGLGFVFTVFGDVVVSIVFGSKFDALVPLMPWFGVAIYFRYVAAGMGIALTAFGSQWVRLAGNAISVCVLIAFSYVFSTTLGTSSVAAAVACSNVVLAVIYLVAQGLLKPEVSCHRASFVEFLLGGFLALVAALGN